MASTPPSTSAPAATPSRLAALAADRSAPNSARTTSTSTDHGDDSSSSSSSSESDTDTPKDQPTPDPSALLARLTATLTCTICNDLFLRPHALACGHTFCFPCASNWLATAKRRCPLCRTRVFCRPCFVYPLAEAVAHVRGTAIESVSGGGSGQGGDGVVRDEEMQVWERLFGKDVAGGVIADTEDGVRRCFNCHWEIVGHECTHCGMHYDSDDFAAHTAQGIQDADGSTDGGDMSGEDIGYPTDDEDGNGDRPVLLNELGDADEDDDDESGSESARNGHRHRERRRRPRRRQQEEDEDEMNTDDEQFLAGDDEVEFDSDASESVKREHFDGEGRADRRRHRRRARKDKKTNSKKSTRREVVEIGSSDAELVSGQADDDNNDDAGWESDESLMDVDPPVSSRRGRHDRRAARFVSDSDGDESESDVAAATARPQSTTRITISTDDDEDTGAGAPVAGSAAPRTGARRIVVLDDDDDDDAQDEQRSSLMDTASTAPVLAVVFSSGESDEDMAEARYGSGSGPGSGSSSSSSSSSSSGSSSSSSEGAGGSSSGSESDDERSERSVQQFVGQSRKRRSKQGGGGGARRVGFKRHRRR